MHNNNMASNPPMLNGKRKRATVNYAELANEDNIINDFDDAESADERAGIGNDEDRDESFSTRRKVCPYTRNSRPRLSLTIIQKPTKKAPPKKKLKKTLFPKSKPKPKKPSAFRFLDLPPELRDEIYELALTDDNGVSIVGHQDSYRHVAHRGRVYASDAYLQTYRRRNTRYLKDGQKEVAPKERKFVPALLATNKQINAEAINFLYRQNFVFQNPTALHSFLAMIGLRNQQRLENIAIMSWGKSGVAKGNNHSSLTLLAGATNLKSLGIMCDVSYYSNKPQWIARRLFRDGHWFFEAYGAANGRKDAAVDIIQLSDENFKHWYLGHDGVDSGKKIKLFKSELRSLLDMKR